MQDALNVGNDRLDNLADFCLLGYTEKALADFKVAIGCSDEASTKEQANEAGLPLWYYMWLRLGDLVLKRERESEYHVHRPRRSTTKTLAELDAVLAELEVERENGEFSAASVETLRQGSARGNSAALAIQGLLLLKGCGSVSDAVSRERAGTDIGS